MTTAARRLGAIGNTIEREVVSLALNRPQTGRLRPFCEQTAFPVAPPAIVRQPVIVAATELRRRELSVLPTVDSLRSAVVRLREIAGAGGILNPALLTEADTLTRQLLDNLTPSDRPGSA